MKQQFPQLQESYPFGICLECAEHEVEKNEGTKLKRVYCEHHQAGAVQTRIEGDLIWTILVPMSRENFEQFSDARTANALKRC